MGLPSACAATSLGRSSRSNGVFVRESGRVRFVELAPPSDDDVMTVLRRAVARLERLLHPRLVAAQADARPMDALGAAQAEAMHVMGTSPPDTGRAKKRAAYLQGFSLHAAVHLHANDREGLAHLCGYGARPPFRHCCCSPPNSCAALPRWSRRRAPTSSAIMVCLRPPQAGVVRSSRCCPTAPRQRVRPAPPGVWGPRIPRLRRLRFHRLRPLRRYGALRIHRAFPGPSC